MGVNAENLSELAQSVSRSSASAGKAKSMFGLSFLDPEPHYIEDFFAKGTDQGPHSQKKPEGSVKKSLAVSVLLKPRPRLLIRTHQTQTPKHSARCLVPAGWILLSKWGAGLSAMIQRPPRPASQQQLRYQSDH